MRSRRRSCSSPLRTAATSLASNFSWTAVSPRSERWESATREGDHEHAHALTSATGPVRAEGKVVSIGRRVAFAEGRITDAAGRLYASGTSTLLVFGRKS